MTSKSSSSRWSVFHTRLVFNFFTSLLVRNVMIPILNANPSVEVFHHISMIGNSSITCPTCFPYCTSILTTQHRFQSEDLRHKLTKGIRKVADVWEKDVWELQAKSGSSGSCRLFLHFLGKIADQKMSGRTPGSPRHPSSRHPRPSEVCTDAHSSTSLSRAMISRWSCRIPCASRRSAT